MCVDGGGGARVEGIQVNAAYSDLGGVGGKDVVFLLVGEALNPIIAF